MTSLEYTVTFHGPFLSATGLGRDGLDLAADLEDPLASASIKGVMRSALCVLLGDEADHKGDQSEIVREVYGGPGEPSPWNWSSVDLDGLEERARAQVSIDPETGVARDNHLLLVGELWAAAGSFRIEQLGHVPTDRLELHRRLLDASACAVHHLGKSRRRGRGWVTISPVGGAPVHEMVETVGAYRVPARGEES